MDSNKNKDGVKDSLNNSLKELAPFFHIGLQMSLPIVILVFVGIWLDNKFDTMPIFTLLLSLYGVFAGFYYFFKALKKINK